MPMIDDLMEDMAPYAEPSAAYGQDVIDDPETMRRGEELGADPNPMYGGSQYGIENDDPGSMISGGMTPGGMEMGAGAPVDETDQMREMLLGQLVDENTRSEQYQQGVVDENQALQRKAAGRRGSGVA
jgi:hypothetical protein